MAMGRIARRADCRGHMIVRPFEELASEETPMTHLTAAVLATFMTLAGPALAQTKTPQPPHTPTMLARSPVSMTSLLKKGWTVVSGSMGSFTLNKDGKWMLCEPNDVRAVGSASSECRQLN